MKEVVALVVLSVVAVALVVAVGLGAAVLYDRSWSCPPGSIVVLDGMGLKSSCVVTP